MDVRKRGRTDGNHAHIVAALRKCGWLVQSLAALGDGCPDLLVCKPGRSAVRLVEVKQPKGTLTADQEQFIRDGWPVTVVRSIQDAIEL